MNAASRWLQECDKFGRDLQDYQKEASPTKRQQRRQRLVTTLRHLEKQLYQHSEQPTTYQLNRQDLQQRGQILFRLQNELDSSSAGGGSSSSSSSNKNHATGAMNSPFMDQSAADGGSSTSATQRPQGNYAGIPDMASVDLLGGGTAFLQNTKDYLLGAVSKSPGGGSASASKETELRNPTGAGAGYGSASGNNRDIEQGPNSPPLNFRSQQQKMFQEQDQNLDMLAGTVGNLKQIGGEIHTEVQYQGGLVENLGDAMDDSQSKMKSTTQMLKELDKDGSLCFWWVLIIALFVLNVVVAVFL
ncbi:unnamed protein product [Amoebophrya sp. A120]|nr:unnamed protein product [Amoebophrya sp. A120]|eukprot:GSA120T00007480001.1